MSKNKIKDFDSFFNEAEGKPIKFKLFGKEESIPASLPAIILVKLNRANKKHKNDDLPVDVLLDLSIELFGEKKVESWSRKGLTSDQLAELIKWAMEQYNPGSAEAEAEVEDEAGESSKKK